MNEGRQQRVKESDVAPNFSIPSCSPGQRGITPAFGYSAPHPSTEGTSTPMIHALPSAQYSPLGRQVLARGIAFIDLVIAQVAGLGVPAADALGFEPTGWRVQVAAGTAALLGALNLTLRNNHHGTRVGGRIVARSEGCT
jgi:hypothetical protein